MNTLHGILAHEGQSPDGIVFHRGDQVTIFDDGRNDSCNNEVHVLNHQTNQAIVVPVSAVCWVPTHSESRPAGVTLFTIYGRRITHHQPGDPMPSLANRAIKVLLGSGHQVTHTVVTEDDISTWAQRLEEPERQAFFTYQWNSLLSDWPARDMNDLLSAWPCQDSDGLSEGGLSMGTTNSCISSPTTPALSIDQIGGPRRDSAVDVSCSSHNKDGQDPMCFPGDEYSRGLNPYLVSSEPGSPTGYDAIPLPTFAEQQSVIKHAAQAVSVTAHPTATMGGRPSAGFMASSYLGPSVGQIGYTTANEKSIPVVCQSAATDFQVNYMYLPSSDDSEHTGINHHPQQRYEAANNDASWSQQAATEWPSYQSAEVYQGVQSSDQSTMPPPVNQETVPRAHMTPMPLPALSENGHYMTTSHYEPVPIQRFDDRHAETFGAYSMASNTPAFHRTQERQTVGLTAPPQPPNVTVWAQQQSSRPGNGRTPVPQAAPVNFRRSPSQQSSAPAFRPELIVDFFTRQTQPHIDVLDVRQREQQDEVLSPEQSVSPSVSESLEVIRTATAETLRVLGTLRPGSMPSFNLTEQRLRGEVEKIIASVQSIRQIALAGNGLPQQDRRALNQQVQSLAGYIEYLGEVFPDMVEPAKASEPVTTTQTQPSAPSSSTAQRPSTVAAQTAHPANGMAINREHQRLLRQLAEDVVPSHPRMMNPNVAPAPSAPQPVVMMPGQDMMPALSGGPSPIDFHQPNWADASVPTIVDPAMSAGYPAVQSISAHSSPYLGPAADPNPRGHYLLPGSVAMATTASAPGIVSTTSAPSPLRPSPRGRLPLVLSPMPMPVASFDRRSSLPGRRVAQPPRERERYRAAPYPQSYRGTSDRKGSI
ncbi:hypothetical protein HYQ45_003239 [Verticillium longisporum]|uniref:Uncharacterized protein n=1 Tax=Verticillium longisporum TaxID=100787 RepID=A0A8I2ZW11_VERLO|nr:hypothetical protein HYQ44_008256 [Verticillium longisporum]KAG7139908.1 hypothetical protein HYQ45_003239 [Verticillium longisporum]